MILLNKKHEQIVHEEMDIKKNRYKATLNLNIVKILHYCYSIGNQIRKNSMKRFLF